MRRSARCRYAWLMAMAALPATSTAGESLMDAIGGGKVDFYARLRYEHVEDDGYARAPAPPIGGLGLADADALTLRSALGYTTGVFHGFGAALQFEDVRALIGDYNDGSFTAAANGLDSDARYATVVDPEGTEVQQANIRYEGLSHTVIRAGRQEIEHRQAPLHRYVGNILWRQNWQSFDAVRVTSAFLPALDTGDRPLKLDYAYAWNVNRIFGEDNDLPDRADYPMNSHLFRANWDGFGLVKLEGYVYSLDFDRAGSATIGALPNASFGLSTNTVGVRGEGGKGLGRGWTLLYSGEFAHQMDAYETPEDIDVSYYFIEGGVAYAVGRRWLDAITVKAGYEVLEGDGVRNGVRRAFQTPLGTNHAFQGWADKFLVTPGDGIRDLFLTLRGAVYGANVMLMYHDYASDHLDYDYGREWNAVAEKPLGRHWMVGAKYARYEADDNAANLARNAADGGVGQGFDRDIFWAYVQFRR